MLFRSQIQDVVRRRRRGDFDKLDDGARQTVLAQMKEIIDAKRRGNADAKRD